MFIKAEIDKHCFRPTRLFPLNSPRLSSDKTLSLDILRRGGGSGIFENATSTQYGKALEGIFRPFWLIVQFVKKKPLYYGLSQFGTLKLQ